MKERSNQKEPPTSPKTESDPDPEGCLEVSLFLSFIPQYPRFTNFCCTLDHIFDHLFHPPNIDMYQNIPDYILDSIFDCILDHTAIKYTIRHPIKTLDNIFYSTSSSIAMTLRPVFYILQYFDSTQMILRYLFLFWGIFDHISTVFLTVFLHQILTAYQYHNSERGTVYKEEVLHIIGYFGIMHMPQTVHNRKSI